jgi:dTDP-4-amino-4,6-dideoxygalactose transaminase
MQIPLCDPKQEYAELKKDIDTAVHDVMEAGQFILGPNVRAFEGEMGAYLGCKHTVGVNSGTDALHLALRALGIGPGDEVITTPFTFIATTEAIQMVGARPVFVDIELSTYNIDPSQIEAAITTNTKAILPVHLYGRPCDMGKIVEIANDHKLKIIEDCAQSIGASWEGQQTGTIGDVGCFSFFPSKNLGCMGDGGMLVTNDPDVHARAEMLRRHGAQKKYHHTHLGFNSRLDELQAAILRVKLPQLDRWNKARITIADRYRNQLAIQSSIQFPSAIDSQRTEVYHQFTILDRNRDALRQWLADHDTQTAVYYPIPLHLQAVNSYLGYDAGAFPVSEHAAANCLSLPMYAHLTLRQQDQIASTFRTFFAEKAAA